MYLEFVCIETLPKLSWCAQIKKGSDSVVVHHGVQVEVFTNFFAEGAWNGDFSAEGFISATILCGSGAVLEPDRIRFSSSTDTLAPVFSILKNDVLYVSNSPMFALSAAGEEPDPVYPFYAYDMVNHLRQGLYCKAGKLKTASGTSLQVHFNTIMSVTKNLSVSFADHPVDEKPQDYGHYKKLLLDGVRRVFLNGNSPSRRYGHFHPLALVSRGYDCNATAALAAAAGCSESATLFDSHRRDPFQDSGAGVARFMGMKCMEKDRWAYLERNEPVESEFAYLTIAANPSLSAYEEDLAGRIMVVGNFGDGIWDKKKARYIHCLARPWLKQLSGMSQLEFRLRTGYLMFAPAYICATHSNEIDIIMHSEEMHDWSIGGKYDRPLPRRIVEEAGVPREEFGMRKLASSQVHFTSPGNLSIKSLFAYKQFARMNHGKARKLDRIYWYGYFLADRLAWWMFNSHRGKKPLFSPKCPNWVPIVLNGNREFVPWKFSFMFQWAFDSIKPRYKISAETPVDTRGQ